MINPRFILLACLAALAVLAGSVLSPVAQATRLPLVQDEPKRKPITISGIAILPDGGAAAKLPVSIKKPLYLPGDDDVVGGRNPPPDALSQLRGFKTLAASVTDAAGRFAIKFDAQDAAVIQLEIGDKSKSAWIIKPVMHQGKDVDLGSIPLSEKVLEDE